VKKIPKKLQKKIRKIPREKFHKVIHELRVKHKIARKTSYYMKEYGPRSHVISEIIKDSLAILLLTSLLSSLGGFRLEEIKQHLFTIIPFLILIPALNDMVGDFGTILSSRVATALFMGKIEPRRWWKSVELKKLLRDTFAVVLIITLYIALLANLLAILQGFAFTFTIFLKILLIATLTNLILFALLVSFAIIGGTKIFMRKEDPNNFLVPISTAVADLGTMVLFAALVILLF
jgi:cation transporter-like permease